MRQGRAWQPTVIPTGSKQPPIFCQILTHAIGKAATSRANFPCAFDAFIDNIRVVANREDEVRLLILYVRDISRQLSIQLNPVEGPAAQYVFLGISFDHQKKEIGLGPKACTKLQKLVSVLETNNAHTLADLQSMFGVCNWAALILQKRRAPQYYIYKFLRRKTALFNKHQLPQSQTFHIWPSVVPIWESWAQQMANNPIRRVDGIPTDRRFQ